MNHQSIMSFEKEQKNHWGFQEFFKDPNTGKPTGHSTVLHTSHGVWDNEWEEWKISKHVWKWVHAQVNKRLSTDNSWEAKQRRAERGEGFRDLNALRQTMINGLLGEWYVAEKFGLEAKPYGQDKGNWGADLMFPDGTHLEVKTSRGDYEPGLYERGLKDPDWFCKNYYWHTSPQHAIQLANNHGYKQHSHNTHPLVRDACKPNEFLVAVRVKQSKGKWLYKISYIVNMVELQRVRNLCLMPWDDNRKDRKEFAQAKGRLIEELVRKQDIKFYAPAGLEHTYKLEEEMFPALPVSKPEPKVAAVPQIQRKESPNSIHDSTYDTLEPGAQMMAKILAQQQWAKDIKEKREEVNFNHGLMKCLESNGINPTWGEDKCVQAAYMLYQIDGDLGEMIDTVQRVVKYNNPLVD